jgi:RNA polymerase sigma factor (sigma-70 family)
MATGRSDAASDAEWIALSSNEPSAFGELFTRHADSVFRYLSHLTDRATAEDLLGETFAVAFAIRVRYDGSFPDARAWLFGVATNVARRHRRSEGRRRRADLRLGPDRDVDTPNEFELATDRLSALSLQTRVDAALAMIPEVFRAAILLFGGMGLTYEEVALALDIPIGTVRSRISRGRVMLREQLGDLDDRTNGAHIHIQQREAHVGDCHG